MQIGGQLVQGRFHSFENSKVRGKTVLGEGLDNFIYKGVVTRKRLNFA